VLSARLAQRGYTGTEGVFDVDFGGVLSTLGGDTVNPEALTSELGQRWETTQIEYKSHAACAAIHTALDAAGQIRDEGGLGPDDVDHIVAHTTTHTLVHCGWPYRPSGMTAAQMNLQFGLAAVFVEGGAGVRQYTEEKIADPRLVDFSRRVEVIASPEFDALGSDHRHTTTLYVTTRDGREFERTLGSRRGSISNPLPREEVIAKYRDMAGVVLPDASVARIEDLVWSLDQVRDVSELGRALTAV
jgi:2-methylcitrate dehydratase PrpD